jgi:hypothetical protein
MKLSAPSQMMFLISIVVAILGLIGKATSAGPLTTYDFWLTFTAFIVLALACMLKGI